MRVVFSIDFTMTFIFGVMGELASFKGLKLRTELMIRPDVFGRVRIRIERQLRVASTTRASLWHRVSSRFEAAALMRPTRYCHAARPASYRGGQ
jgi:hypothetical protein